MLRKCISYSSQYTDCTCIGYSRFESHTQMWLLLDKYVCSLHTHVNDATKMHKLQFSCNSRFESHKSCFFCQSRKLKNTSPLYPHCMNMKTTRWIVSLSLSLSLSIPLYVYEDNQINSFQNKWTKLAFGRTWSSCSQRSTSSNIIWKLWETHRRRK